MGRRLAAEATPSWAPSGTFSFDGSSSDLALQLYTRYAAGDTVAQLDLSSSSLPDDVSSRLSDAGVAFDDLDGFAQRALLWDSGFGVTPDSAVKQIWTLDERSMAEIALTLDQYESTACTAYTCTQPDGTSANNNQLCTGTEMLTAVKCVIEDFDSADQSLAMWSVGGESNMIPEIGLQKHAWTDSGVAYTIYAVHTLEAGAERDYGACPSTESYGYLNIPCYGESDLPGNVTKTQPTASDWVTSWVQEYAPASSASSSGASGATSSSFTDPSTSTNTDSSASSGSDNHTGTNVALLGGAIGGGLALLLIGVIIGMFVVARRKRRRDSEHGEIQTPPAVDPADLISPGSKDWSEGQRPTVSTHPRSTIDDSLPRSGTTVAASSSSWPNNDSNGGASAPPYQERVPFYVPTFGIQPPVNQEDPVVQPPLYQDNVRPSTAREPPVYLADPVVQPPLSQESGRSGAFVQPPPYEEALRNLRDVPTVNPPATEEKIFGLGADNALQMLVANPNVARRRLQLGQLQVERQLPMATLQTDLSVARYNGRQVLVTRLAPSQHVNHKAVEELASEILIRADVAHPNLVQFVGVNWSSARDLAMVVEYLPLGNLAAYLSNNKAAMTTWTAQKTGLAVGIARAIAYLHRQTPPYIHPTIRAKNVLMASHLVAKLADCGSPATQPHDGISKSAVDQYWTAPEVMQGGSYSTAADIYAFGVLLSELDTCQAPYQDAISSGGIMLGPSKILELVAEGRLRPSFSAECPTFIRQLGVVCCQQDPAKRPTALQVVQVLEGN
ncbi:hypothetical protein BBJ28_00004524 [Nothophytophthora sp. Chile5]|nr:hypothetical protein BBJ28_00004524 [Nothophytophthora sp. Chile5]